MPYNITEISTPSSVGIGDEFEVQTRVCCDIEEGAADVEIDEGECAEKRLRGDIRRLSVSGPFGIWSFPILNMVVGKDLKHMAIDRVVQVQEDRCESVSSTVSLDEPGEYEFIVTIGDNERAVRFTVEE